MRVRFPRRPELLAAWGRLLEAEQPQAAMQAYRHSLWVNARQAQVWYRLGVLGQQQGAYAEAVAAYSTALRLNPAQAPVGLYLQLAMVLGAAGQQNQALALYLEAIVREPEHPYIFFALAQLLQAMGDQELALEALMTLGKIYPARLDLVSFWMGYSLEKQGQTASALQCYDEAIKRRPQQLYWQLKRDLVRELIPPDRASIEAASQTIESALERALDALRRQPAYLRRAGPHAGYAAHEEMLALSMIHASVTLAAYYHTPQLKMRKLLAELISGALPPIAPWQAPVRASGRLRLGIVIAPKSLVLSYYSGVGMAEDLDPERFEVVLLSCSLDVAKMFAPGFPFQVRGRHMSWQLISPDATQAAQDLRGLGLDAVFFTEPAWDFEQYLLAMYRVAPLQFTSWMTPGTSGLVTMDAFLSHADLEPAGAEADYTESLERWSVFPGWIPRQPLPAPVPRADFGLADDWHVYGCLQNILKLHPDFDRVLGEILRRDPRGQVVMVSPGPHDQFAARLMKRFAKTIPDVMPRIWVFPELDNQDFLRLYQCCDLALDPLWFGGGNTVPQAMACGLATVTLPAPRMVGRIAAAFYRFVGVPDGIVGSEDAYIAKALELAADPILRADIRRRLLEGLPRLLENPQAGECLGEFLLRRLGH